MISYKRGGMNFLENILKTRGSVFGVAFAIALPCSMVSLGLNLLTENGYFSIGEPNSAMWNGFNGLMGFLIVFRTSQAYSRFWEGCSSTTKMRSQWLTACSSAVVFSKCSKEEQSLVLQFQHTLVRLCSLLHMLALAEIEDSNHDKPAMIDAFKYEVLDLSSFNAASMKTLSDSDSKVELVFQWIQQLIADNVQSGVLGMPPPIVSRVFQELGNGMVQFHEALKLSSTPFPFPYAQICDCLLVMHWLLTPCVMSQWAPNPFWAAILSFVQVFTLWSLNAIAVEIENPFGTDPNDIDAHAMQLEFNRHVSLLVDAEQTKMPSLVFDLEDVGAAHPFDMTGKRSTFLEVCRAGEGAEAGIVRSGRAIDQELSNRIMASHSFRELGRQAKLVRAKTGNARSHRYGDCAAHRTAGLPEGAGVAPTPHGLAADDDSFPGAGGGTGSMSLSPTEAVDGGLATVAVNDPSRVAGPRRNKIALQHGPEGTGEGQGQSPPPNPRAVS